MPDDMVRSEIYAYIQYYIYTEAKSTNHDRDRDRDRDGVKYMHIYSTISIYTAICLLIRNMSMGSQSHWTWN